MWGVNGAYSFMAEQADATSVRAVDVFGPTPEFDQEKAAQDTKVEFILGTSPTWRRSNELGLSRQCCVLALSIITRAASTCSARRD